MSDKRVRMVTVTAPGEDAGLVWDASVCAHLGPHSHTGHRGCRVLKEAADAWNSAAPRWWTALNHDTSQAVLRRVGARPAILIREFEQQRRGLLHVHVVLGYSTLKEKAAADQYVAELCKRAPASGFGFVDRNKQVMEASAAAAYLSSYFVSGKKGKVSLTESVQSQSLPRSIVYVAPRLSKRSGITMRTLRLKRYLWVMGKLDLVRVLEMRFDDFWRAERAGVSMNDLVAAHCRSRAP